MNQDNVEGKAKEVVGRVQQSAGDLTDDPNLKAQGQATEAEGKTQGFFGKVKQGVSDAVDTVKNKAEDVANPNRTTDKTDTTETY